MKNLGQKCAKCGKTNHSTQNHWPGGKHPQKGKGQKSQKVSSSSGKKKADKKGKGKEKAQMSANVLDIADIGELSITSSESINFSCYETSETVEWFLDSGCTDHITPRKSDFVQYRELGQLHKAEITDRKYLKIEGFGMIIGHSKMPHGTESWQIQQTIINEAEAMWHHTGLSNSFWIYAMKAKLHTYNVTPIKWTDYKTPKELWSGQKPNISHLRVFGCLAWVHILKKRRHNLEPKS